MDWKKLYVWIELQKQATLIVKLYQDGYRRQGHFIRDVIDAYINEEPEFMNWMNKKIIEKGNSRTKLHLERKQKLINKAQKLEDILFSQQDLDKIFDLIEKDN
jgi:3'-phosphoadenosine 5'-phosphosulfate sulfotransferase (PAPS reductase)/FAD synthetase